MAYSTVALPFLKKNRHAAMMQDEDDFNGSSEDFASPSGFLLPPVADPALYCRTNLKIAYHEDNDQTLKFDKGTTTLAFCFKGGILAAVDSRSTQGPYIASQEVDKINEITPYMLATIAGGAADCQYWQRNLAVQCRMYELRNRHRISIRAASKLIANTCNYYKAYGLSLGMMMMGYDNGEPTLYYVDDEGSRMRASKDKPKFSVGSGSTYAYGVLDNHYRWDLEDDEAIELGLSAIYQATYRDSYSGGLCRVYLFKPDGYSKVRDVDVKELHDHFNGRH
ncbi:Proteasome subunit beta type-5 [Aphanomyces cochlioides]|nr:Proteasome subunit beta type-5 [Aphanomyces cochlioides]